MKFLFKLLKALFNRTTICIVGILIQIAYLVSLFWTLGTLFTYSYVVFTIIAVIISLYIMNSEMNPSYKIAWIFAILVFPIFGVMLYVCFGNKNSGKRLRKQMAQFSQEERLLLKQNENVTEAIKENEPEIIKQTNYLYSFGGYPVYSDTQTTYFNIGEAKFAVLLEELEKAERFIFLEYFIIEEGRMWNSILEILERKAKQGVDVRVIYDDIGCLFTLPYKYNYKLEEKGIKCRVFNKFRPVWSSKMNNRDHRKILVIDGNTAFNGGINLADEYINEYEKHGHWKDSAVMLKGEAVWSFTVMFLSMWNYLTFEKPSSFDYYYPHIEKPEKTSKNGYIVPFTDSPLDDEPVGENVYINIINNAKKYVYITTPYLIISNEMMTALTLAAKAGVDVRIITPHIADKWFVHAVTRAHYKTLISKNVKIYEYTPGFIHAKNFVADDNTAVVGTINLDFRSLYLHFECATLMYKTNCISDIKEDFLNTLDKCEEITLEKCQKVNPFIKLLRAFLRFFAPMM